MISNADRTFATGATDIVRRFADLRRRVRSMPETFERTDFLTVHDELLNPTSPVDKVLLVDILRVSGPTADAIHLITQFLATARDPDGACAALHLLADSAPGSFAVAALPYVDGNDWDTTGQVRRWAMTYAGGLIRRGDAMELLDPILRLATEPGPMSIAKKDARFALMSANAPVSASDVDTALGASDDFFVALARHIRSVE